MNLNELQRMVVEWADSAFPNRTPSSAFMKLFSEIGEVIDDPESPSEWADAFILMLDLARMHGVKDLDNAVLAKLMLNRRRTWVKGPLGVFQHDPNQTEPDISELYQTPYEEGRLHGRMGIPKEAVFTGGNAQDQYDKGYELGVNEQCE